MRVAEYTAASSAVVVSGCYLWRCLSSLLQNSYGYVSPDYSTSQSYACKNKYGQHLMIPIERIVAQVEVRASSGQQASCASSPPDAPYALALRNSCAAAVSRIRGTMNVRDANKPSAGQNCHETQGSDPEVVRREDKSDTCKRQQKDRKDEQTIFLLRANFRRHQ